MAILKTADKDVHVADGSPIKEAARELGIYFGCESGICGTCLVDVEEGMENLEPKTKAEEEMGLVDVQRLCCQATIQSGTVIIKQ